MVRHSIERSATMALGFLAGVMLAMCVAPGDVTLWIATGVVLGLFTRAFLASSYGGEVPWPFAESWRHHKGK